MNELLTINCGNASHVPHTSKLHRNKMFHIPFTDTSRDRPIMLIIILPIMLCYRAHKVYLLYSKVCSRIRTVVTYLYANLHE